jgi:Mn-dependent DtxR family transcriptional regulator
MGALDYRDRIRAMVEQQPVQPTVAAKELSTNSMLASAMLSEMSEKGLLKVSNLKVGSSPLYYHPDHPEHLLNFVQHLNDKDRKTVALLKDKGVLRDNQLDSLTRVSLRNTKDFAKPLDVSIDGVKELFWKFYLLTDEQSAELIKKSITPQEAPKAEPAPAPAPVEAKPKKPRKPRARKAKPLPAEQQPLAGQPVPAVQAPVSAQQPAATLPAASENPAPPAAVQPAQQAPIAEVAADDAFLQQLTAFFSSNSIKVLEQIVIKKKNEYDFLLSLPSPVGELHYYCKAKNKAKVGEADLSHAFVQGQLKKLPVLFLAPGQLTKPAQDLVKELKGLAVKQV